MLGVVNWNVLMVNYTLYIVLHMVVVIKVLVILALILN